MHPFQEYLDLDLESFLAVDDVNDAIQVGISSLFHLADVLRGLFLIASLFDSVKFGVFLYALTYVGEMFNLLTIFIIALVLLFAVPKVKVDILSFDISPLSFVRCCPGLVVDDALYLTFPS